MDARHVGGHVPFRVTADRAARALALVAVAVGPAPAALPAREAVAVDLWGYVLWAVVGIGVGLACTTASS